MPILGGSQGASRFEHNLFGLFWLTVAILVVVGGLINAQEQSDYHNIYKNPPITRAP